MLNRPIKYYKILKRLEIIETSFLYLIIGKY